jgi:AcrR family transcriptional regulator
MTTTTAHSAALPRKRRSQAERSAETKRRLLEATIDCIVERGYARTTTSEIVSRAGLTRGAQLHHFVDRDTLLLAAVEYLFEGGIREFNRAFAARAPERDENDAAVDPSWQAFGGRFGIAWLEMLVASRADKQLANAVRTVATRFAQKLLEFGSSLSSLPVEEFALSQSFEVAVMLGLLVMGIAAEQGEFDASRVAVIELLKEFIHALGKDPGMLARVLRKTAPLRLNGDRTR